MNTENIVALVSGANRGLGRRFAAELVARGAKVYAGARNPDTVDLPGVVPVRSTSPIPNRSVARRSSPPT